MKTYVFLSAIIAGAFLTLGCKKTDEVKDNNPLIGQWQLNKQVTISFSRTSNKETGRRELIYSNPNIYLQFNENNMGDLTSDAFYNNAFQYSLKRDSLNLDYIQNVQKIKDSYMNGSGTFKLNNNKMIFKYNMPNPINEDNPDNIDSIFFHLEKLK